MDAAILAPANLLRYFGQVLIVVAAAELGSRLVRPTSARLQLACWRLVIAVCLLLPFIPVRSSVALTDATASFASRTGVAGMSAVADTLSLLAAWAQLPWLLPSLLPSLLIGGAIARAAWLGLGFARLRQLRAHSCAIDPHDATDALAFEDATNRLAVDVDTLKHALAPHADVRWHDDVTQPLTFGLRRPIVILPRRLVDLPPDAQRAIVCHELLHVARQDWAWMLAEEALRTACWWHPAIWWALGHVQLHREEAVDADVIVLTAARRAYMYALLAFADQTPTTRLRAAPTMPFIRRRHLATRLAQLAQEVPMSRLRLTCAVTTLGVIIAAASWASISALPLQSGPPTRVVCAAGCETGPPTRVVCAVGCETREPARPAAAPPINRSDSKGSDDKPIRGGDSTIKPRVLVEVKAVYPQDARDARVQGEVEVEVRIARDGSVADARVVKSIPMLDKAALGALRKWKFEPPIYKGKSVEVLCRIMVRFTLK